MERIDDLEINGYKICQDTNNFCFGIDAVLLANFLIAHVKKKENIKICDLCSGNIPIPLIIYAKKNFSTKIYAFEINKKQIELSKKSLDINRKIDDKIDKNIMLFNDDIKNIIKNKNQYKDLYSTFDNLTVNPPYMKLNNAIKNIDDDLSIARHEIKINFDDICDISYLLLKSKKSMFMIHKTQRLTEIIYKLKKHKLEPKLIQFIHPFKDKQSNLFLVEAVKDGNEETKVLQPIIIYNKDNSYTDEVLKTYGK